MHTTSTNPPRAPAPTSSTRLPSTRLLSALALLGFLGATLGFGAMLDGFSHATHPVALLGARGVPRWWAFDLFGFVLPGLLAWASIVRASIADNARAEQRDRMRGVREPVEHGAEAQQRGDEAQQRERGQHTRGRQARGRRPR